MLNLLGPSFRTCDGVSRRSFLSVGALTAAGLTMADLLRSESAARAAEGTTRTRKSCILIWQAGGPSHIDMYDLKPDAPSEYRGEFRPIRSNVPGIDIGEHLPLQAKVMDRMSIVRSATHTQGGHGMASQWMLTGYQPTIEVNDNIYPSCGSVVAKLKGTNEPGLPAYVNLPREIGLGKAAYLGASYNPFASEEDPNNESFRVRNLKLPSRIDADRLARRRKMSEQVDQLRRDIDASGDIAGLDKFYRDAMEMVTSDKAQKAFDIKSEDPKLRELYGRNTLGQSCLLARRLVESGVTYVTVQAGGGWDSHSDNFKQLKETLLPNFDRALAALVTDIFQRGLQNDVLVMAMGEFGRTPRINPGAGRDHWPGAASVVYSGGGLRMGQAIGTTDPKAEYPATKPYSPGCVLSTMYHALGVDYKHIFYDQGQRPLPVLNEGKPIPELI